jgi:hypothetical protein
LPIEKWILAKSRNQRKSETMSWNQLDNKQYRGAIDRIYVSMTEYYEVHHFVDHYLQYRKAAITQANRQTVHNSMNQYTGRVPVMRDELVSFLDQRLTVN